MGGLFGGKNTVIDNGSVANFQINQSTYGLVVPIILGTSRQSGNIIDYFNFTKIAHKSTQRTGKGGGSKTTTINYTYKAAILIALCEGQIDGIGKVWIDTDTVTTLAGAGFTLFDGAVGQPIWSYTESVQPDHAIPYSGLAYVAGYVDLNSSGGVQTYNFEIKGLLRDSGDGTDINPSEAVKYILLNPNNGLDFTLDNIHAESAENFKTFCKASDLFVTVPLTDQSEAYKIINTLCEMTNTIVFWSQSKIKFVPRCEESITGNEVTYTPNTTPEYDLDADDFLEDDDGKLVTWERTDNAETYNQATVEFTNRENDYEKETVDYQILADVNKRGLRPMPTVSYPYIHTKARAEYIAQRLAMDSCYSRNTYRFKLGWSHCLLEPGDIVTITDEASNLNKLPVMIESISESDDGELECEARYRPYGTYSPAKYETYASERASIDRYVDPGDVNPPVIFEPPEVLGGGLVVWIGASGGPNWGGCDIWVSDDGVAYKQLGTIRNPSRQGVITSELPMGIDPDELNMLSIDMTLSRAELLSGTRADADNYNTLCYLDGELVSYETATLTDTNRYDLSYLRRGAYGTKIKQHDAGSQFLRVDIDTLFSYPFLKEHIGKTIYLKFVSFNTFGLGHQSIEDVQEYYHVIGSSVEKPGDLAAFSVSYLNGKFVFSWRNNNETPNAVGYEIRKGDSFDSAQFLMKVPGQDIDYATFPAIVGSSKFWICPYNEYGYAENPLGDSITIDAIPSQQIIASFNNYDKACTLDGSGAQTEEYSLQLSNITYADLASKTYSELKKSPLIGAAVGQVMLTGPVINFGTLVQVMVGVEESWLITPDNPNTYEVSTSLDGVNFSDYKLLSTGSIPAMAVKLRITMNGVKRPGVLAGVNVKVTAQQNTITYPNTTIPIGGLTLTFTPPFLNAPSIIVSPNGNTNLTVQKSNVTNGGGTVQLLNGTTDVGGAADIVIVGI